MKKLLTLLFCAGLVQLPAQLIINEVASTNYNITQDEEGDYPDWIELYNAGPTAVNLAGYAVSEGKSLTPWVFKDSIIPANGRVLVYASGKNRNCQTCPVSDIDHWETAIFDDDIWEYKNGTSEPPSNWNDVSFAGGWATGPGGFGTGDGDDNTIIGGFSTAFYYRKEFEIVDKSKILETIISMDYDDGYVVYINNVEVARINMIGSPTHSSSANYWHEALMYLGYAPKTITLDPALMETLLVDGTNVIAVEIHQYFGGDDATGRTWLHFGMSTPDVYFFDNPDWFSNPGTATELHTDFKISNNEYIYLYNPAGAIIDSIYTDYLQVNQVRARIPDAGGWCYAETSTPLAANAGTCYSGYAESPVITTNPGFYDGSVDVTVTGTEIYYTTDGSNPEPGGTLYTAPITFSNTGVLKAIQVETGKLPSPVVTGSYFIDEPITLPVISVIGDPCDLFNEGPDCIGAYDNAEGWFNHNPKISVAVEYYDTDKVKQFGDNFKFECVGNYSVSLAQKSMRFVNDEDYGTQSDITYNLFERDKPGMEFIHGFRVRNADQDYYGTRMKDITINRIGMPTRCVSTAYQNCVVFINGEYWGMYGAREEMDEYFLRDNFGVNPDAVDLIKTGWGGEEKTMAEAGSDTAFQALLDLILDNDMTDPDVYAQVVEEIDVTNWVDYIATEVFTDQEEWLYILENNIRLFRSYAPDIKWRYMLWDCTNSQFSSNANTLQSSLNNPNNSLYGDMFNALLENETFHDYFINRFADLINYYFTEENNDAIVDELKAEMEGEIPRQNTRWGTGSYASWNSNVNQLYTFYDNRNTNQRNHIKTYFGLAGQVDVTLEVNPPGAGYVKISTIVPENLPWTGVYFNGVPVTVTAIPNPGFEFVNWSDNPFIDALDAISFTNNFTTATAFTANFTGSAITNPIVISEINYNPDASFNGGDWIELHNSADVAVNVSSYQLKEKYFYSDFTIPENSVIPANGYLVLAEDKNMFNQKYPTITNVVGDFHFSLKNDSDLIVLTDMIGDTIIQLNYADNRPWPFTADGYGRTMELAGALLNPALPGSWFEGCIGGSPGEAYTLCMENPLVDEINYNSAAFADAGDWFELYNYGTDAVDISGWFIKDKTGHIFTIPNGTSVGAESYLAFYSDAAKFATAFPDVTNKLGPLGFSFDGNGDVIVIYKADGVIYQSVGFDDASPYPLAPDGGGMALQIVDVMQNINFASNWKESCPEGTPGTVYLNPCQVNIDDVLVGELMVYPNPANQSITIELPELMNTASQVMLYDLNGKNVYTNNFNGLNNLHIPVYQLMPGIYMIKLQNGEITYTGTFVKQ